MGRNGRFRDDLRNIILNLIANLIWLLLTLAAATGVVFLARSTEGSGLSAKLTMPAWLMVLFLLISVSTAVFVFITNKRASVIRGRAPAAKANVDLLASRSKLASSSRVIRSTRFGRWPPQENLSHRADFRQELDKAILNEGCDVRRIWNISSAADVARLRELLTRYQGNNNHSIRAYFGLPDHVMPELLVVDECGASISFVSTRTAHTLDWAVQVRRPDLVHVIKDYFEVLWDRAERILDSGEPTAKGMTQLNDFEADLIAAEQP